MELNGARGQKLQMEPQQQEGDGKKQKWCPYSLKRTLLSNEQPSCRWRRNVLKFQFANLSRGGGQSFELKALPSRLHNALDFTTFQKFVIPVKTLHHIGDSLIKVYTIPQVMRKQGTLYPVFVFLMVDSNVQTPIGNQPSRLYMQSVCIKSSLLCFYLNFCTNKPINDLWVEGQKFCPSNFQLFFLDNARRINNYFCCL